MNKSPASNPGVAASTTPTTITSATTVLAAVPISATTVITTTSTPSASPQMKPVNLTAGATVEVVSTNKAPAIVLTPSTSSPALFSSAATAIRIPKVIAPPSPTATTIMRAITPGKTLTIPQPLKTPLLIPQPSGAHRLPPTAATYTPLRMPTMSVGGAPPAGSGGTVVVNKSPAVSLAVLQQGMPEGAKLCTVVHAGSANVSSVSSATTTIRPLNPVTIRSPHMKAPHLMTGSPVQFVPLPSMRCPNPSLATMSIRQPTTVQFKPHDHHAAAMAAAAAVRVTLIQSSTSITKTVNSTTATSFFKPVTITTQSRAQHNPPPIGMSGTGQPLRIGLNQSRMTVIPSVPFGQQVNVTLNPVPMASSANPIPLNATPARILTTSSAMAGMGGATRLISVPISSQTAGSTVSIHKAVSSVPAMPMGTKTISLPPYIPKSVTGNLPVARVIPQPLTTDSSSTTSLFIARPQLHITSSEGGGPPVVLSSAGTTVAANVLRPGLTIHTANAQPHHQFLQQPQTITSVASGTQIVPTIIGSPSRPGILRRREGERVGDQQADLLSCGSQIVPTCNLTLSASGTLVPASHITTSQTILQQPQLLVVPSHALAQPVPSPPHRPESGGSSSGSTTLSATSSPPPGDELAHNSTAASTSASATAVPTASGGGGQLPGPSPRKKPRKQAHVHKEDDPNNWVADENRCKRKLPSTSGAGGVHATSSPHKRNDSKASGGANESTADANRRPCMSLINSYRHTWKSRHNHFLRYTDIKAKEERRPTVNELANQKYVLQKVNGWKIYHLTTQIEDIAEMEKELSTRLNGLHKRLEKGAHRDLGKDVSKVQEIIKANLQRSKLIQDQLRESKANTQELFDHKEKVVSIINRYVSKRQIKKREIK